MNFPSGSSISKIIYGGVAFLAFITLIWCRQFLPSNIFKRIKFVPKEENNETKSISENKDSSSQQPATEKQKSTTISKSEGAAVLIEDDDNEEEGEEEEDDIENRDEDEATNDGHEAALKALEESFESASRLAYKYFAGGNYAKAVEKYTEAIELAGKIPSASNQIISLYNNRSAMFEKCGRYDESLGDIQILLAINPTHVKARSRRARISCIQGRKKEALFDFVFCQTMERLESNGQAPLNPANVKEIEELTREIAAQEGRKIFEKVRLSRSTLPGKAFCRNYLDSFPSIHYWRTILHNEDRDKVYQEVVAAGGYFENTDAATAPFNVENIVQRVKVILQSIWYEILFGTSTNGDSSSSNSSSNSSLQLAFERVNATVRAMTSYGNQLPTTTSQDRKKWNVLVARLMQLQAMEYCFRSDMEAAEKTIRSALSICPITIGLDENANSSNGVSVSVGETVGEEGEGEGASSHEDSSDSFATSPGSCAWETVLILSSILIEQSSTGKEPDEVVLLLSLVAADTNKLLPKENIGEEGEDTNDEEEEEDEKRKERKPSLGICEEYYLRKAWIALHMASYHIRKNEKGWYRSDCLTPAMTEIQSCLDITENPPSTVMKAVRLIALKKATDVTFFVQSMVKAQSGNFGDKNTAEEIATAKEWIADAWKLAQDISKNTNGNGTGTTTAMCTVLMLESELMMNSGDLEAASLLSERAVTLADADDAVPLVSKGNVLLQKTLMDLQSAQDRGDQEAFAQFPILMNNVKEIFEKALEIEPQSLDALAQLGQYYSLIGDLTNAVATLEQALDNVRTLAEAVDLSQIYLSTSAQAAAVRELQPPTPPT